MKDMKEYQDWGWIQVCLIVDNVDDAANNGDEGLEDVDVVEQRKDTNNSPPTSTRHQQTDTNSYSQHQECKNWTRRPEFIVHEVCVLWFNYCFDSFVLVITPQVTHDNVISIEI